MQEGERSQRLEMGVIGEEDDNLLSSQPQSEVSLNPGALGRRGIFGVNTT